MSKLIRTFLVICILSVNVPLPLHQAFASELAQAGEPAAIATGVRDFARVLDGLGGFEELGEAIPFTTMTPSDEGALRLGDLFSTSFTNLAASFPSSLAQTHGDVGYEFTNVVVAPNGDLWDVSFDMSATVSPTVPIVVTLEDPDKDTHRGQGSERLQSVSAAVAETAVSGNRDRYEHEKAP